MKAPILEYPFAERVSVLECGGVPPLSEPDAPANTFRHRFLGATSKKIQLQAGRMDCSRLRPAVKAAGNRRTPRPSARPSSSICSCLPGLPSGLIALLFLSAFSLGLVFYRIIERLAICESLPTMCRHCL